MESIISDRICSFLHSVGAVSEADIYKCGFYQLIMLWRFAVINPGSRWEECSDLIYRVDKWRSERNKYIHKLVKFPHGKAQVETTEEFLKGAEKAAMDGEQLAREVSSWRQRQSILKRNMTKSSR